MAVIHCVECRGSVSTLASACPHCGAPVSESVKPEVATPPGVVAPTIRPPVETGPVEAAAAPIVPKPMPQAHPPSLDAVFRFKILGLVLILAGIGYAAYLIVSTPTPIRRFGVTPDVSAEADKNKYSWLPTYILFVAGGAAFNAARVRQNKIEELLRKKS